MVQRSEDLNELKQNYFEYILQNLIEFTFSLKE
jgi:hypothetical protein